MLNSTKDKIIHFLKKKSKAGVHHMLTTQLGVRGPPHMLNNPCIVPWHISTGNPNLAQSLQVEMQPRKDEPARPLFRAIHSSDKLSMNRQSKAKS